jgi:hypothetical protein
MLTGARHGHPTVFARKIDIAFDDPLEEADLKSRIGNFLNYLTKSLENERCELIGHIKGLCAAEGGNHLMFSVTSFDETVHYKGTMHGVITGATLTMNIVVFGVGLEIVEKVFHESFKKHLGPGHTGRGLLD